MPTKSPGEPGLEDELMLCRSTHIVNIDNTLLDPLDHFGTDFGFPV